jgi:hypothetical protein
MTAIGRFYQAEIDNAKKETAQEKEDKEAAIALLRQHTGMNDDQIAEAIKEIKAKKQVLRLRRNVITG